VIVDRAEPAGPGDVDKDNPLSVNGVLVYPNIGAPIRKSRGTLPFYIVIAPGPGTAPAASLEILREGATVATLPMTLPAPDAGRQNRAHRVGADCPVATRTLRLPDDRHAGGSA
jgi:hypothetical protein